nr:reducing hydrogenase subunit alpha [Propionibacterium sp.]
VASGGGVPAARAVLALHSVEAIADLLERPALVTGPLRAEAAPPASAATGWVEGPRGLLAHTYEVDAAGTVSGCRILTPTAQNEPWLAALLAAAARAGSDAGLEASIRAADPCLPCASAPAGAMGLAVTILRPDGPP